MQLSARILTALAVLAFVVGVVVGAQNATDEVSAATGTIDALNVGACTTNNADVFDLDDCTQTTAFFEQGELDDLIEVDTVYATYSHDPKTAAENPRAIIEDGDLLRISITDKDRDRRDPVLITTAQDLSGVSGNNGFTVASGGRTLTDVEDNSITTNIDESFSAGKVVGEAVGLEDDELDQLPLLEQVVEPVRIHFRHR